MASLVKLLFSYTLKEGFEGLLQIKSLKAEDGDPLWMN